MYKMPARKALILAWAGLFFLTSCATQQEAIKRQVKGQEIKCNPPGEEAKRVFAVSGSFKSVLSIVKGSVSAETKWQRIRQVSPKAADFDIIVWRICEAYANQLITKEQYAQMVAGVAGVASGTFDPAQAAKKFVLSGDVFEKGNTSKRIEGATVELNLAPLRYTTTDANGTFRFTIRGMDEGKAPTLRVTKEGEYEPYTKSQVALAESTGALRIGLEPKRDWFPLKGRIRDSESDKWLNGAQVLLETTPVVSERSQSEGRFLLKPLKSNINKEVKLRIKMRGYREFVRTERLTATMEPFEIRLQRAFMVIRARIVDSKGKEIEGAIVTLNTDKRTPRKRSKSDGGVLFDRVPALLEGKFVGVRVEKEGYETLNEDFPLEKGKKRELVLKPLSGMGEYRKGLAAFRDGSYAGAVQLFARAAQINPNLSQAHFDLGRAQAKLSNWGAAAVSFKKAGDLDGQRFDYQLELAKALVKLNRFDEAMPRFGRAAKLQPNNPDIYFEWARALASNKQSEEAVAKYRQSIALNPNRYEAYEEASGILYKLGTQRDDSALVEESLALGKKGKALKAGKPLPKE
jgi:tetratricopeptide (TPR) repeat protein